MSDIALARHYLKSADRRFARDPAFYFYVFDWFNRKSMMQAAQIQAIRINSRSINETISNISTQDMHTALNNLNNRIDAARRGQTVRGPADLLLSLSNNVAAVSLGSNSERKKHRRRSHKIMSSTLRRVSHLHCIDAD